MDFVHLCRQAVVGLIGEGGSNNLFYARAPGRIREEARINAVSSDEAQCFRNFHEARIISGARRGEPEVELTPPAPLDVQLRERLLQGSLHCRDFFLPEIFFHRRLRSRHSRFCGRLVDHPRLERHVSEDRNR